MKKALCEIVRFFSGDGYIYTGLLFLSAKSRKTVIHVHGACGNFISFSSLTTLANYYRKNGINMLTFNLKGHDCIVEGNWKNNRFEYVGGSVTDFDECVNDIGAAVKFCNKFSDEIILQGHSMGCERVITYQLRTKKYFRTILISPCDAYGLQTKYLGNKTVEEQISDIKKMKKKGDFVFFEGVYGIKTKNEKYEIPVNKQTMLSIFNGLSFKLFRADNPKRFYLPIDCICCVGKKDKLQTMQPENLFKMISDRFDLLEGFCLEADHEFKPKDIDLAIKLTNWIKKG